MKTLFCLVLLFSLFKAEILQSQENSNADIVFGDEVLAYCYQPMSGSELKTIYTIDSDGSGNQMLMSADIGLNHHNWSPDGSIMACVGYADENTWSIYTFDTDGTNLIRLTTTDDVWDSEPSWSPDGSKIAFSRIYPNQNNLSEIWIMDMDGNNQFFIGIQGFGQKWSIDGNQFIYQSSIAESSDIFISNIDRTGSQQITFTNESEGSPEWSPDGTKIAFVRFIYNQTDTYEIFVMNSDGSNEVQLTNNSYLDHYPRWSPDGSRLAFITDQLGQMQFEVYIMNADGTGKYQLTFSPTGYTAINPAWKPGINSTISDQQSSNLSLEIFPNPFTESTIIKFNLIESSDVKILLYNSEGKLFKELEEKNFLPGENSVVWNGKDKVGNYVPAGMYIISVQTINQPSFKKLIKNQ